MNAMQQKVFEFHKKFGLKVNDKPTVPDVKTKILRMKLIQEESQEVVNALLADNMKDVGDGLADLLYVTLGCACAFGLDIEKLFEEVHRSNMTKVWEDGTIRYNEFGKVVKPPTYSPANIEQVIKEMNE